jgi:hypothetical protein
MDGTCTFEPESHLEGLTLKDLLHRFKILVRTVATDPTLNPDLLPDGDLSETLMNLQVELNALLNASDIDDFSRIILGFMKTSDKHLLAKIYSLKGKHYVDAHACAINLLLKHNFKTIAYNAVFATLTACHQAALATAGVDVDACLGTEESARGLAKSHESTELEIEKMMHERQAAMDRDFRAKELALLKELDAAKKQCEKTKRDCENEKKKLQERVRRLEIAPALQQAREMETALRAELALMKKTNEAEMAARGIELRHLQQELQAAMKKLHEQEIDLERLKLNPTKKKKS